VTDYALLLVLAVVLLPVYSATNTGISGHANTGTRPRANSRTWGWRIGEEVTAPPRKAIKIDNAHDHALKIGP